jgi:hypothetical protein
MVNNLGADRRISYAVQTMHLRFLTGSARFAARMILVFQRIISYYV